MRVHAPCPHFTRPSDLFESGCIEASADDSEEQGDERLEDDLAIEKRSSSSTITKRREEDNAYRQRKGCFGSPQRFQVGTIWEVMVRTVRQLCDTLKIRDIRS